MSRTPEAPAAFLAQDVLAAQPHHEQACRFEVAPKPVESELVVPEAATAATAGQLLDSLPAYHNPGLQPVERQGGIAVAPAGSPAALRNAAVVLAGIAAVQSVDTAAG